MARRAVTQAVAEPAVPAVAAGTSGHPARAAAQGATGATGRRHLVEQSMMEHAARLFAERGFAGTSLQDVADAMGLTRPALYYYVKSKDELLARLIAEITSAPAAELWSVAGRDDLDAAEKLRTVARIAVEQSATHGDQFRLLVRSEAELPPDVYDAYTEGRRSVLEAVSAIITAGVLDGTFRPVDAHVAAFGILGMCNWVAWWFREGGQHDQREVGEEFAQMAVHGLLQSHGRELQRAGPAGVVALLRQDLELLERHLQEGPDSGPAAGVGPAAAGPPTGD